jgi:hypothetical protein
MLIALLAKLSGQHQVRSIAEWAALRATELAHVFQFPRATMPHPVTWSRVLGTAVNVDVLQHLIRQVLQPDDAVVPARASIALALDGKTLRGTIPLEHTQGVHLLAAYLPAEGVVLMQVEVDTKDNEIVLAPTVVVHLDLTVVVVMGDALYTQRPLSTQIVDAGGDYVWVVNDTGLRQSRSPSSCILVRNHTSQGAPRWTSRSIALCLMRSPRSPIRDRRAANSWNGCSSSA